MLHVGPRSCPFPAPQLAAIVVSLGNGIAGGNVKIYRRDVASPEGTLVSWHSNEDEANRSAEGLKAAYPHLRPAKTHIEAIDFPTAKEDVIKWLNAYCLDSPAIEVS
jgi:hypothetical protein